MGTRKAEKQRAYRDRTGSFMDRTREEAVRELIERHRDEYEAILADVRQEQAKKAAR